MIVSTGYKSGMKHHYVPCECHSMDHMFAIVYFEDKDGKIDPKWSDELFLEVQMIQHKEWYKRAWAALKYTFGYTSRYGHWDSASITPEEAGRMRELLDKFIAAQITKGNVKDQNDQNDRLPNPNDSGC